MKAVLYARFSPRPNAAECESCEVQLAELRAYCQREGLEVRAQFRDRALSGADDRRPGLARAIDAVKRGDVLLVRSWDRLFKDARLGLMAEFDIQRRGAEVRSITEDGTGLPTELRDFMRGIFLLVAEYQRKLSKARTSMKMRQHQANGRRMSDRCPFGWTRDPKNSALLVEVAEEQQVIRQIIERRRAGDGFRQIGRHLDNTGVTCRGGLWHHTTVKAILRRADYDQAFSVIQAPNHEGQDDGQPT